MLTIDKIKNDVGFIAKKYNIERIDLFGSYADGTQTEKSDADFLVKFSSTPSIFKVMGFKEEVEKNLKTPVDIVTLPLVRPEKLVIERTINIYEK